MKELDTTGNPRCKGQVLQIANEKLIIYPPTMKVYAQLMHVLGVVIVLPGK